MKLNPDCMRDILIYLENELTLSVPRISVIEICDSVPGKYDKDDVIYSCKMLADGHIINSNILKTEVKYNWDVYDITYECHQLLASIRNEKIWEPTKSIAKEIGATSIQALTQIATGVVTQIITKHLGY